MISNETKKIVESIIDNNILDKKDFLYLLNLNTNSFDVAYIKSIANYLSRKKNSNAGLMLGQIAVETGPCNGGCKFCSFGEEHTNFEYNFIEEELFKQKINDFCKNKDLYGLYFMTINTFNIDKYINYIKIAKKIIPKETRLFTNIGDTNKDVFKELKDAGISGVYHVKRINEGIDTKIKPETRIETIQNAQIVGLDTFTCLEPIGPEHTNEQLVEDMFIGIDLNCKQHAVMRRVPVPRTAFEKKSYISNYKLSHILAVLSLAVYNYQNNQKVYVGVHEPNLLGYNSGANIITAESGRNPRDIKNETLNNRGLDLVKCRNILYDSGFEYLINGREQLIKLDLEYINKTNNY